MPVPNPTRAGVLLLIAAINAHSIMTDRSLEITTSAALIVNYLLGLLVGLGHIFTPVAGAIRVFPLGLNAYLDWQTRFIKILAFKTAKVAGISELI